MVFDAAAPNQKAAELPKRQKSSEAHLSAALSWVGRRRPHQRLVGALQRIGEVQLRYGPLDLYERYREPRRPAGRLVRNCDN